MGCRCVIIAPAQQAFSKPELHVGVRHAARQVRRCLKVAVGHAPVAQSDRYQAKAELRRDPVAINLKRLTVVSASHFKLAAPPRDVAKRHEGRSSQRG